MKDEAGCSDLGVGLWSNGVVPAANSMWCVDNIYFLGCDFVSCQGHHLQSEKVGMCMTHHDMRERVDFTTFFCLSCFAAGTWPVKS